MTRSRTLRRLLVIAALGASSALILASCSVGVGTPPEDFVAPDEQGGADNGSDAAADVDLLVDGADDAVADLIDAVGAERVKALQLAIYTDSIYLEAQNPTDPTRVDIYNWNPDEGVTTGGEKDVSGVDLAAQLFPLNQVNLAILPDLVDNAPGRLGIQGDITSSVSVQRPAGSPILTTVFVSTPRGANGAVVADQNGNILATS